MGSWHIRLKAKSGVAAGYNGVEQNK